MYPVKKMIMARIRPGGNATIDLLGLNKKNPAKTTPRKARLIKKELSITNLLRRSGGFE
jgi:hypothetical protein